MAKKAKETNVPLIFALVFFILTSIAFGVMWYLSLADIEAKTAEAKKARDEKTPLQNTARENELKARVYRLYMGIEGDPEDKTVVANESKPGDVIAVELKKINEAVAKKLGVADAAALSDDFKFWMTDTNNKAAPPPAEGLTDQFGKLKSREVAYKAAEDERDAYKKQIEAMKSAATALAAVQKKFQAEIDRLPAEFKADLKKVTDGFDSRTKAYQAAEALANKNINDVTEVRNRLERELRKEREKNADLTSYNERLAAEANKGNKEAFKYDEPQGKVLRRLPDNVVEINLGSAVNLLPGLTFTVQPNDFPVKGELSRTFNVRVPDGRGGFRSEPRFVPRGKIEVFEVVGPNLSLARVTEEADPIRDGVAVGDLLYNSTWRKGVADRIALIGIFDVNGDGTDDITSVVRDLTKMGVPVDAYYDLKTQKWVGQVTERTRFIVEGYIPGNSATDPHREQKSKLLGAIAEAIADGKKKGVNTVNFRDFFNRMGYKFRLDVTDDKIDRAVAPYLSNVGTSDAPPP